VVTGQPLEGTAQGEPCFCRQFSQRAVVEKMLIDAGASPSTSGGHWDGYT